MTVSASFFILLVIFRCSQAFPNIMSDPEIQSVSLGQAVMFRCQINNPQDGEASWSSINYNFKISQGNKLLAADSLKYSIKSIAGGMMYNLQILNISKSDEGYYKCAIEGTDQKIISQLVIVDKPGQLVPQDSLLNVTDCCINEGVTGSCLPICYPSQINTQKFILTTNCGTVDNVKGLSKCFAGGSNNYHCCLDKKVDPLCLDICQNTVQNNLTGEYFSKCYAENVIKLIFNCFQKGFESLPSEPVKVTAEALCDESSVGILVKWLEPIKNQQTVTGYMIMYKARSQTAYNSVLVRDRTVNQYLLQNKDLVTDIEYNIHISALADFGSSFDSVDVNIYLPNCTTPSKQSTIFVGTTPSKQGTTFVSTTPSKQGTTFVRSSTDSSGDIHRYADDDTSVNTAIGVGVGTAVIFLTAIAVLVFYICKIRLYSPRMKTFTAYDNPDFSTEVKLQGVIDKDNFGRKQEIAA